jgi:hypothetical protein
LFGLIVDRHLDKGVAGGFFFQIELPDFEGLGLEVIKLIEGDDDFISAFFHDVILGMMEKRTLMS